MNQFSNSLVLYLTLLKTGAQLCPLAEWHASRKRYFMAFVSFEVPETEIKTTRTLESQQIPQIGVRISINTVY